MELREMLGPDGLTYLRVPQLPQAHAFVDSAPRYHSRMDDVREHTQLQDQKALTLEMLKKRLGPSLFELLMMRGFDPQGRSVYYPESQRRM